MDRDRIEHWDEPGAPSPQEWLWAAERLRYAGHVLWEIATAADRQCSAARPHPAAPGQRSVAFLLFGYAFENVIKGLITQRCADEGKLVRRKENGELDGIPMDGHSLRKWAVTNAGVKLSSEEADLLDRLSAYVQWVGRYPVIKKAKSPPGTVIPNTAMYPDSDERLVDSLFEKMVKPYQPPFIAAAHS